MKIIALLIGVLIVALVAGLALFIGSGFLVLSAYGLGLLLKNLLPFSLLETTALCMAGVLWVSWALFSTFSPLFAPRRINEEDYVDVELDDHEESAATPFRHELKINRNALCPCGSGRKYKNCHGRTGGF